MALTIVVAKKNNFFQNFLQSISTFQVSIKKADKSQINFLMNVIWASALYLIGGILSLLIRNKTPDRQSLIFALNSLTVGIQNPNMFGIQMVDSCLVVK